VFTSGRLRADRILVKGEPLICDFGIAPIVDESAEGTNSNEEPGEAVRYSAPELIENNDLHATMSSDTYSFAMLILECISEKIPFSDYFHDAAVLHARITRGEWPPRPDGWDPRNYISDDLWDLMQHCWSYSHENRPTMEQVHRFFLF